MTAGMLLTLLIAVAAAVFVVLPLLRRDALESEERPEASIGKLRESHERQQMLLASLKDLEDDRATDKLDEQDYEQLKSELSGQAIEVMQRIDALEQEHDEALAQEREASRPLQYPSKGRADGGP